ncbi:hypothetical protein PoB_004665900, partial [Plakobranchus ocellatus]
MIDGKHVLTTMEDNSSKQDTAELHKELEVAKDEEEEDDVSSSSSSSAEESDVDDLDEPEKPEGNSALELTLKDDEQPALIQPEVEGEADETLTDSTTPYTEDYGEFEGEGAEETGSNVAEIDEKKDVDKKKKKKKKKKWLSICLTNCKYDV